VWSASASAASGLLPASVAALRQLGSGRYAAAASGHVVKNPTAWRPPSALMVGGCSTPAPFRLPCVGGLNNAPFGGLRWPSEPQHHQRSFTHTGQRMMPPAPLQHLSPDLDDDRQQPTPELRAAPTCGEGAGAVPSSAAAAATAVNLPLRIKGITRKMLLRQASRLFVCGGVSGWVARRLLPEPVDE